MATQITDYPVVSMNRSFSWTGIFAGTFLFLAIELTFGILGRAILGPIVYLRTPGMVPRVGIGTGIWMIILSIIALYFAGKLAARLCGAYSRNTGMYAGLVTFGMCIAATVLLTSMPLGIGGMAAGHFLATTYWMFIALVLAMIASAAGGIHGSMSNSSRPSVDRSADVKRVA